MIYSSKCNHNRGFMRKIAALAVMVLLGTLSACNDTDVPQTRSVSFPGQTYGLNIGRISIVDDYQSSKQPPHVELLADITPSQAARQWTQERLDARGNTGYAEVVIKDAHIIQKALPKQKSGVEGYFTNEQTQELDGRLEMEIKIYDGAAILPVATVRAVSENSMTLPENATIMDRKNAYYTISIGLMHRLEPALVQEIQTHFSKFLM